MLDFLKRNYRWVIILLFLLLSIQIITYDISHPGKTGVITRIVLSLSSYPVKGIKRMTGSLRNMWDNYIYLVNVKKENYMLKKKIDNLLGEIQLLKEYRFENERLKKILGFVEDQNFEYIPARVVGITQDDGLKVIMIDKGQVDGVTEESAVIVPDGVIGRVFRLGGRSSLVMLITDPRSNIDVRFERTRVRAILHGTGGQCEAEFVKNDEDVVKGDIVITSGLGGIFPKNNIVGYVRNVETKSARMFKKILVEPATNLDAIDEVLIVKGSQNYAN
jgi:rod shape-determining protein MreC